MTRRPHSRAAPPFFALLLFAGLAIFAACDDDDGPSDPTPTPGAASTAAPVTPIGEPPADDLGSLIGPRADLPIADPIALAERYGVTDGRASAAKPFAGEANVGDTREFSVALISSASAPAITAITATLLAKSEHAYFYVDDATGASQAAVQEAADTFEAETWPTITGVFGEPPIPGVDGDPRIVVLQADLGGVGGYHSADDLYVRAVRPLSNEAEMVYIDVSNRVGGASFDVVVAHELQHLILDASDLGEEAWVNEGLSVTAEGLAGGSLSVIDAFEQAPSTQLNRWEFTNSLPHYGASGAFLRYLADRFGGDPAMGEIARATGDGPAGIDEFLAASGDGLPFQSAFADWLAANLLNRADGAYANPSREVTPLIEYSLAEGEPVESAANQFGVDYYELSGITGGEYVLRFDGEAEVDVLPVSPDDGAFFWSNTGDAINTTMTFETTLDFEAPVDVEAAALTFETWYDIEESYDRGYVSISIDDGETWRALPSTSTTTDDPVRIALGPGFDGRSGADNEPQWITESVDLTEFAGQTVQLRFEMVTDGGTHGEGWAIRNINLAGSDTAVEINDADWQLDGWVRIDGALPQAYVARLIGERADGEAVVFDVPLDEEGNGELRFDTNGVTNLVLAVAGTTEGTNVKAPYRIELARP